VAKTSFTFTKRGWEEILSRCKDLRGAVAKVGVQGSDAEQQRDDESGMTNLGVAVVHEFNEPFDTPPGRPFIRPPGANDPSRWKRLLASALTGVIERKENAAGNLRFIGELYRKAIIDRMKSGISPPLAESTINRRKGQTTQAKRARIAKRAARGGRGMSVVPLIDSGTLLGSISVVVTKEK
jgi:hypothetical protein